MAEESGRVDHSEVIPQESSNFSSPDTIGGVANKFIDLLGVLNGSDADSETLRLAKASLENERLFIQQRDSQSHLPNRDLIYGLAESLEIAVDWMIENEEQRKSSTEAKIEIDLELNAPQGEGSDFFNVSQVGFGASDGHSGSKKIKTEDPLDPVMSTEEFDEYHHLMRNKDTPDDLMNEHPHRFSVEKSEDSESMDEDDISSENEYSQDSNEMKMEENEEESDGRDDTDAENKKKYFTCDQCDYRSSWNHNAERHKRSHLNDEEKKKPHKCDQCERRCTTKQSLERHKKTHLSLDDREKFDCEVCGKRFIHKRDLQIHGNSHIDDEEKRRPYKCDQCAHRSTQKQHLQQHKKTHMPVDDPNREKFDCEICDKSFTHKTNLKRHEISHMDDEEKRKPHKCDQCEYRSMHKQVLELHKKTHLPMGDPNRANFDCKVCGKRFTQKGTLSRHAESHIGKPLSKNAKPSDHSSKTKTKGLGKSRGAWSDDEENEDDEPVDDVSGSSDDEKTEGRNGSDDDDNASEDDEK